MPVLLVKDIEANLIFPIEGGVKVASMTGEVGEGDYIELFNFIAYLQDFSRVVEIEELPSQEAFGLKSVNKDFITIECSF